MSLLDLGRSKDVGSSLHLWLNWSIDAASKHDWSRLGSLGSHLGYLIETYLFWVSSRILGRDFYGGLVSSQPKKALSNLSIGLDKKLSDYTLLAS